MVSLFNRFLPFLILPLKIRLIHLLSSLLSETFPNDNGDNNLCKMSSSMDGITIICFRLYIICLLHSQGLSRTLCSFLTTIGGSGGRHRKEILNYISIIIRHLVSKLHICTTQGLCHLYLLITKKRRNRGLTTKGRPKG